MALCKGSTAQQSTVEVSSAGSVCGLSSGSATVIVPCPTDSVRERSRP